MSNNKSINTKHIHKFLFIGLDNSGKSTIITKLKDFQNEESSEITITPFINHAKITVDGREVFLIEISGHIRYRDYWKTFFPQVEGIVFVIDGTDTPRLPVVKELINKMFDNVSEKLPIAFLINKYDLDNCSNKSDIQNYLELDYLDSSYNWQISNSIGFSSFGVKEALKFLISKIHS